MGDPRKTQAWQRLRDQVVSEEPTCRLRTPSVCTHWSETADHIESVHDRPDLALERANLRGSCHPCNQRRGRRPAELEQPRPAALAFFD